jgi:predicted dienelactone hydrolase
MGIWYPSDAATHRTVLELDPQDVAKDAPIAGSGLKLVMISHGQGGSFVGHFDTAIALANAGFVAAAITHTGDNWRDQSRVMRPQDRSRQLRVATDWILHQWPEHARIATTGIGLFGFSAGGFTVLVDAGGVPDTGRIAPHCADHKTEFTCALIAANMPANVKLPAVPAAAFVHDPRVRAVVVAAPALGFTFGKDGLASVKVPVQLWRAEDDHVLPQPFYAQAVHDALPAPPEYHAVPHADHFDFLAPCDAPKAARLPQICTSEPGFDRVKFHAAFNAAVVAFFKSTL